MASELDICNLALSRLGDDATVSSLSPPEGSMQAEHCARFYPISRDTLLSMHEWNFATTSIPLAQTASDYDEWNFAYALPSDVIKIVEIKSTENKGDKYVIVDVPNRGLCILTDMELASAKYIKRITDTSRFSAMVVDATAWLLASNLSGPLIKGETGAKLAQSCYEAYLGSLQRAILHDVEQYRPKPKPYQPVWIGGR